MTPDDPIQRAQELADQLVIQVAVRPRDPADADNAARLQHLLNAELALPERQADAKAKMRKCVAEQARRMLYGTRLWRPEEKEKPNG
jgi:hypothetical protein